MKKRALELLADGTVTKVLGWVPGDFCYDITPAMIDGPEAVGEMVYNSFCGANQSKYLIEATAALKEGEKILVFLKPCDTYSFNQLLNEHRFPREKTYVIGVGCKHPL